VFCEQDTVKHCLCHILILRFSYVENLLHFNLADFSVNFIKQFVSYLFWCLCQILLSKFLFNCYFHYTYEEYCISYRARPLARNSLRQIGQRAGIVYKSPPSCIQLLLTKRTIKTFVGLKESIWHTGGWTLYPNVVTYPIVYVCCHGNCQ